MDDPKGSKAGVLVLDVPKEKEFVGATLSFMESSKDVIGGTGTEFLEMAILLLTTTSDFSAKGSPPKGSDISLEVKGSKLSLLFTSGDWKDPLLESETGKSADNRRSDAAAILAPAAVCPEEMFFAKGAFGFLLGLLLATGLLLGRPRPSTSLSS